MTELCYHSLFQLHHGLVKSEILSTCPVESSLWLVRIAEFHRAGTKQIQNPNSLMFKTNLTEIDELVLDI